MILDRLLLDNFITTSTVMARKECLIEVGMFNVNRRISHDFELWLRMAARWKIAFLDRALVRYRYRPGSLSDDKLATAATPWTSSRRSGATIPITAAASRWSTGIRSLRISLRRAWLPLREDSAATP